MFSLILYRRWTFLATALGSLLFFAVPFSQGLLTKAVFDYLTHHRQLSFGFWEPLALIVGITAAALSTAFPNIVGFNAITFSSIGLMRRNMLHHVLQQPGAQALPGSPGEAITRFRDDAALVTQALRPVMFDVGQFIFAIAAFVVLLRINVAMTLIVMVPVTIVISASRILTSRLQSYRRASQVATGGITSFLGELFGAVQAVKVAGAEGTVLAQFDELNEERRINTVRDRVFSEALWSTYINTTQLGTGVVLLLAANLIRNGSFTVGDFALFVSYMQFLADIPSEVGRIITFFKQATVSFERMAVLMQGEPPSAVVRHAPIYSNGQYPEIPFHARRPDDRLDSLQVSGLTYRFSSSGRGVIDAGFAIERRELVVVTGRIGSGKTTLLRVLIGLLPRDAGTIRWNGRLVDDPATWFVPPRAAYTAQVPRLFSDTLRDNILLGLPEEHVSVERAIELAVLGPDLTTMEDGLNTVVGPRGVRLSGGQVQRAAAARMFVREAEILVVDDLSSALDVETERLVWDRVFAQQQSTVLAVSHRRAALRRADRVIVMADGKIEAQGKLADLLGDCEEMQELWRGARA